MKKNSQTKKTFDVVLLSFLDYKKEGRCQRAHKALSEVSSVYVIDSGDEAVSEKNHTFIPKVKSNIKNVINFTRRAISAAGMVSFKTLYVSNFYTAIAALVIRKQTKCRVIYDAYELFYPEGNEHFSKRDRFFHFFEKRIIRKANAVIAANESRALIMFSYYRLRKMPYVVENISGTPGMLNGVHQKGATCKLVYAGYLSKKRGLAELVEAVRKLSDFHDLSLDIYGAGENIDWFLSLTETNPHFHYHGTYDNNQLPEILSQYDVGFIYYPNSSINNIYCAPNKFYDYVYSGLPIVGNDNYGLRRLASDYQIGCCSSDLAMSIEDVLEHYDTYAANMYQLSLIDLQQKNAHVIQNVYREVSG